MMELLFICAAPRSGTTFLADLLGASDSVVTLQETNFKFRGRDGITTRRDYELFVSAGDPAVVNSNVHSNLHFPLSDVDFYLAIIRGYVAANSGSKSVVITVDQTPDNVLCSNILAKAFPSAKFVHLVRDGRAVFNSVKKLGWGPRTPYAAASWWASHIAPGLALERALGASRVFQVRYEDLVMHTRSTMEALCVFAGIEFVPRMTHGGGLILSEYASDIHPHVGQSPISGRIDAWKEQLSPPEVEAFSSSASALLHWLGYSSDSTSWKTRLPMTLRARWVFEELIFSYLIQKVKQVARRRSSRALLDMSRNVKSS